MKKSLGIAIILLTASALQLESAEAQTIPPRTIQISGSTSGEFTNPTPEPYISAMFPPTPSSTGVGTSNFTWGRGLEVREYVVVGQNPNNDGGDPNIYEHRLVRQNPPNSLSFAGTSFNVSVPKGFRLGSKAQTQGEVFSLGKLSYFNSTIQTGSGVSSVDFLTAIGINQPTGIAPVYPSTFNIINSPNSLDAEASADYVKFPPRSNPPVIFKTPEGVPLTLEILGFGEITGGGFSNRIDEFRVLEGQSASANLIGRFANPCESIIRGAVQADYFDKTSVWAQFTPKFNLTLSQAANLCGYSHFNWHQFVKDPTASLSARNDRSTPLPSTGYIDPPIGGYAHYTPGYADDNKPFYLDENNNVGTGYHRLDNIALGGKTFLFGDQPSSTLLKPGEFLSFYTQLVGVLPDDSFDPLFSFSWKSNFNKKTGSGGVLDLTINPQRISLIDPSADGEGGVFDLRQDLSLSDLPESVLKLMKANGARNIYLEESDSANLGLDVESAAVPEPTTLLGLGIAAATGAFFKKRRMSK